MKGQQRTTQNIMHALRFDLNEWRSKLRHHGWKDESSIKKHALYSNVGSNVFGTIYTMASELDKQKRQRIKIFISSFVLFGFTYYGHNITLQRLKVLERGTTIETEVTKTTSKRTNKTFHVILDNQERDGGENFGRYKDVNVGDEIMIKYLPDVKYVVAEGVTGYRNMVIFQYLAFGTSFILLLLPLIYPMLSKWKPKIFKWS